MHDQTNDPNDPSNPSEPSDPDQPHPARRDESSGGDEKNQRDDGTDKPSGDSHRGGSAGKAPSNPFSQSDANHPISESVQHQPPVTARVPERVSRGIYTTAQIVHDGPKEFVIDFMQGLTRPFQVGARVVVTPATMGEFAAALSINLENYTKAFGPPPPVPAPSNDRRPSVQEIYDNFKLSDDLLSGAYANQVLIGHHASEFFFDFITGFYPHPAVSARIYLAAGQAPRFLAMLKTCIEQYRQRYLNPG